MTNAQAQNSLDTANAKLAGLNTILSNLYNQKTTLNTTISNLNKGIDQVMIQYNAFNCANKDSIQCNSIRPVLNNLSQQKTTAYQQISSIDQQIADINNNQIPVAQQTVKDATANFNAAVLANMTPAERLAAKAESDAATQAINDSASSAKQKTYIIVGLVVVAIIVVLLIFAKR